MTQSLRTLGIVGAVALAASVAVAAHAQVRPGSQQGLGLTGADIPPLLQQIKADPYRAPTEPACESIPAELVQLNAILGPDVEALKTKRGVGQMAAGYVRGLVPYRGVVRFLMRADAKDRELQAAATAGYARRGFLRGLEVNLHCATPTHIEVAAAEPAETVALPAAAVAAEPNAAPVHLVLADTAPAAEPARGEELVRVMLSPPADPPPALPDAGR